MKKIISLVFMLILVLMPVLISGMTITASAGDNDFIISDESHDSADSDNPLSIYESQKLDDSDNNGSFPDIMTDITMFPITYSNEEASQSKEPLTVDNFYNLKNVIENNDNIEIEISGNITFSSTIQINNKNLKFISTKPNTILTIASGRHFNVIGEEVILEFDGNIILDGSNTGGGINSTSANMTLNNAIIQNCVTSTSGGGINYTGNGSLTVNNSKISGNRANNPKGGGIYGKGDIYIYSTLLDNNSTQDNNVFGGGICSDNGNISVVNSIISNNKAGIGGGSGSGGGGIYCAVGTVDINNSKIIENRAYQGGGGIWSGGDVTVGENSKITSNNSSNGNGGGIYSNGDIIVDHSTIEYNTARYNGGGIYCAGIVTLNDGSVITYNTGAVGGGINSQSTVIVNSEVLIDNNIGTSGGGIYSLDKVTVNDGGKVTYNKGTSGGGINGNNITITPGAIIAYNTAKEGGGIAASNKTQAVINIYGGAIEYNEAEIGGGIFCPSDSSNVMHSTINIDGGMINYNTVNASYESTGAGIAVKNGTNITMGSGEIKGNTFRNVIGRGAGIGIDTNGTGVSKVNITGGEINDNGKAIDGKGGTNQGGGIYLNSNSTLNISGSAKISNNTAASGGGVFSNLGSTVNIYGQTEITDNIATASGGAFWIYGIGNNSTSNLNIYGSAKILRNKALNGGAIRVIGGNTDTVNVKVYDDAVISGNIAAQASATAVSGGNGGAICDYYYNTEYYFAAVNIDIYGNALLEGNSASNEKGSSTNNTGGRGGGIYAESIKTKINIYDNAQIKDNEATDIGGGICVYGNGSNKAENTHLNIYGDAKISKNRALNGGGIYAESSENIINISDRVQISDNIADSDGGGIWIQHKNLENLTASRDVVFSGNKASKFYLIANSDTDLHEKQIQTFTFTNRFNNAYNNYDTRYSSITVTFEPNGGSTVNPIVLNEYEIGDKINEAFTATSKKDCEFEGWYKDIDLTQIWNFDDGVTEDITLYAKWNQRIAYIIYKVEYDSNGATSGKVPVDKNAYEESANFTVLDNTGGLVKSDYVFSGWNSSRNSNGQDFEVGKSYPINSKNIILYAQWNPVSIIIPPTTEPLATEPEIVTTTSPTVESMATEPSIEPEPETNPYIAPETTIPTTEPTIITTTPPTSESTTIESTTITESSTEPSIEPPAEIAVELEASSNPYITPETEFIMDLPVNTSELPITETSILFIPENSMAAVPTPNGNIEVEIYEDMPDNAIPLSNGWFAVYLGDDIYEIFDENGVPLGLIILEGIEDIKEWKNFDRLIPLADVNFVVTTEDTTGNTGKNMETSNQNPQTGGNIILALFEMVIICILAVVIAKKITTKVK